eukprot:1502752-Rhodomonas_salina.1
MVLRAERERSPGFDLLHPHSFEVPLHYPPPASKAPKFGTIRRLGDSGRQARPQTKMEFKVPRSSFEHAQDGGRKQEQPCTPVCLVCGDVRLQT